MPNDKFVPLDDSVGVPTKATPPTSVLPRGTKFIPLPDIPNVDLGTKGEAEWSKNSKVEFKDVSPALPLVLGTAGTLLGGPATGAGGAALGTYLNSRAQGADIPDSLIDSGVSGATNYFGGKLLGPLESKLGSAVVSALWGRGIKTAMDPQVANQDFGTASLDVLKDAGINLALNTAVGGIANKIRKNGAVTPEPLENVAGQTRQQIMTPGPPTEKGIPARSTPEYGADTQKAIRGNLAKTNQIEKSAWDDFRKTHLEGNVERLTKLVGYEKSKIIKPGQTEPDLIPKTEDVDIRGPIYTANTQAMAQEIVPKIEDFIKGESFQKLPPIAQAKYQRLYSTIKDLATPFEAFANGKPVSVPVKEFETIKDVRTEINKTLGGKAAPNFPEAQMKKLAGVLESDIDNSIGSFWKNGPAAEQSLARANKATQFKKETFNNEIRKRLYGKYESGKLDVRIPADASEVFNDAYKSPEKATRLMAAMGEDNAGYIKGDYFDNVLMKKGFGANFSKFNPDAIVNDLENPNSVSRVIFNADERNNILRFARAAKASGVEDGDTALSLTKGKFAINLGIGASRLLTGSSTPARLVIGGKQFLEAVKDNKPVADIAQRLIKIRPDSAEAENTVRLLLRGLRGAEVSLDSVDSKKNGKIQENGKILFN